MAIRVCFCANTIWEPCILDTFWLRPVTLCLERCVPTIRFKAETPFLVCWAYVCLEQFDCCLFLWMVCLMIFGFIYVICGPRKYFINNKMQFNNLFDFFCFSVSVLLLFFFRCYCKTRKIKCKYMYIYK